MGRSSRYHTVFHSSIDFSCPVRSHLTQFRSQIFLLWYYWGCPWGQGMEGLGSGLMYDQHKVVSLYLHIGSKDNNYKCRKLNCIT